MPRPPQPDDPPESIILQKFAGLKNTVGSERLAPEELEIAVNVDLDDVGQLRRRQGYRKVLSGDIHSLFSADDDTLYGVKDGVLGIIRPNYSFVPLHGGVGADPISYVQVGEMIYFSSLTTSGKINTLSSLVGAWGAEVSPGVWLSPVINPTATLPQIRGKLLGKPPMATALAYWNGRIYLANGRVLWATELYLYDFVDKTKNFKMFETDITVIGVVTDGVYVGTRDAVWFLSGAFNEMKRIQLQNYGAVPGSLVAVPAELVNPQVPQDQYSESKNAVVFMTDTGLVAGMDSGNLLNLTETEVIFPAASNSAAMFRRARGVNQYVGVLDSGGSPVANTRIGDYVNAEIRRAGTWRDQVETVRVGDLVVADVVHHP